MKTSLKYFHLTVWAKGQVKWVKVAKSPPLMTSQKIRNPQPKKRFFVENYRIWRVF